MSDYSMNIAPALWFCFFMGLAVWGLWEGIDYFIIDETLTSKTLLIPEIKLEIKNNQVDTLYVYRTR